MTIKSLIHSPSEPIPAWYTPITPDVLKGITQRIVEAFQPEKIILFGSYAYGQPQFHSDIDLLVVTNRHLAKACLSVIVWSQKPRVRLAWPWM